MKGHDASELNGRPQCQARRQWQLLTWLVSVRSGFTLAQLAEKAGVTARTIRRDLDVLIGAGFPIERNHEGEGIAIRFVWGAEMPVQLWRLIGAPASGDAVRLSTGDPGVAPRVKASSSSSNSSHRGEPQGDPSA